MSPKRKTTPESRGTTPATNSSSLSIPEATDSEPENGPPAVIASPIRRRQRNAAPTVRSQMDIDVWDLMDEEIIGQPSYRTAGIV